VKFKDLQKLIQSEANDNENYFSFQKLHGLPFWIFDKDQHRLSFKVTEVHCCFWHAIGCPQKDGHDMPLPPYIL
jgi:hypothetical protein